MAATMARGESTPSKSPRDVRTEKRALNHDSADPPSASKRAARPVDVVARPAENAALPEISGAVDHDRPKSPLDRDRHLTRGPFDESISVEKDSSKEGAGERDGCGDLRDSSSHQQEEHISSCEALHVEDRNTGGQVQVDQQDDQPEPQNSKPSGGDNAVNSEILRRRHEELASSLVLPASISGLRLKQVWFSALEWKNIHVKTPQKHGVNNAEELTAWNQARRALRLAKEKTKKRESRRKKRAAGATEGPAQQGEGHMKGPEFVEGSVGANELARLVHTLADDSMAEVLRVLTVGFEDRQTLDSKVCHMQQWAEIAKLYNDKRFLPGNAFKADRTVYHRLEAIDPDELPRPATRYRLKKWWTGTKSKVTHIHGKYCSSGRCSSEEAAPKQNFVEGDLGVLYVWEFALRHEKVWNYTNQGPPAAAAKEVGLPPSVALSLADVAEGGTPHAPPCQTDPQTALLSAFQQLLERKMSPEVDPEFARKKQAAELEHLHASAMKERVQMLDQKIQTLLSVASSADLDPEFKKHITQQIQALVAEQMTVGSQPQSAGETQAPNPVNLETVAPNPVDV